MSELPVAAGQQGRRLPHWMGGVVLAAAVMSVGAEAKTMRLESSRLEHAQRIAWDPAARMLIVTMKGEPYAGKRFGFAAQTRDGQLAWACRNLDLDPKYLPSNCR